MVPIIGKDFGPGISANGRAVAKSFTSNPYAASEVVVEEASGTATVSTEIVAAKRFEDVKAAELLVRRRSGWRKGEAIIPVDAIGENSFLFAATATSKSF